MNTCERCVGPTAWPCQIGIQANPPCGYLLRTFTSIDATEPRRYQVSRCCAATDSAMGRARGVDFVRLPHRPYPTRRRRRCLEETRRCLLS